MAKKGVNELDYYRQIPQINPTLLRDEDLGLDFVQTIQKLRRDPVNNLGRQAMLLRPCGSYNPTSQQKLAKMMDTEIDANIYSVKRVIKNISSIDLKPCYADDETQKRFVVKNFLPEGLEVTVKTDEDVFQSELRFWSTVDICARNGQSNYDEDNMNASTDGSAVSRYGSENEGSLYDLTSSQFNMLRFPNILPEVIHRYMETVAGVTTPMNYVGQRDSFFGPHLEDRDAWSINYNHVGNPKVWYTIAASDTRVMERALFVDLATYIRKVCDGCPAYLRHAEILFHPEAVHKHGIVVKKIIQRQGDLVLIPPRVIHWGFSTQNNIGEAINFTLPESLPFGYHAVICQKIEDRFPTFSMEYFIIEKEPERYKDYVNGDMVEPDPITGELLKVQAPIVTISLQENNVGLSAGGVWEILVAKRQNGQDLVYINSPVGFSWITRQFAEMLVWSGGKGPGKPIKLPEQLFSMHPTILKRMVEISRYLKEDDGKALENIFIKAGLMKARYPMKAWMPSIQNCPVCDVYYKDTAVSSQAWSRHRKFCDGSLKVECKVCRKVMRGDYMRSHMKTHQKKTSQTTRKVNGVK